MNKKDQLLRLIAIPRHFALFVTKGQLRRETNTQNLWLHSMDKSNFIPKNQNNAGVEQQ